MTNPPHGLRYPSESAFSPGLRILVGNISHRDPDRYRKMLSNRARCQFVEDQLRAQPANRVIWSDRRSETGLVIA